MSSRIITGFIVVAIGLSFGANAGYAINPARDLGPRLWAWIEGWKRIAIPGDRDHGICDDRLHHPPSAFATSAAGQRVNRRDPAGVTGWHIARDQGATLAISAATPPNVTGSVGSTA